MPRRYAQNSIDHMRMKYHVNMIMPFELKCCDVYVEYRVSRGGNMS